MISKVKCVVGGIGQCQFLSIHGECEESQWLKKEKKNVSLWEKEKMIYKNREKKKEKVLILFILFIYFIYLFIFIIYFIYLYLIISYHHHHLITLLPLSLISLLSFFLSLLPSMLPSFLSFLLACLLLPCLLASFLFISPSSLPILAHRTASRRCPI